MKHITKVRELYEETIHWISESEDSWKNFLSCMGRLYQLDFLNTCMVYAQRPDASVLAGYDAWLEMDLPVARGSKGIAVFPSKDVYKRQGARILVTGKEICWIM